MDEIELIPFALLTDREKADALELLGSNFLPWEIKAGKYYRRPSPIIEGMVHLELVESAVDH